MKTESLREVKNNLSRIVEELPRIGPVLITKNGRTRAVLLPADDDTDLESLLLSQNKRLWDLIDASFESGRKRGFKRLEDLPVSSISGVRRAVSPRHPPASRRRREKSAN